MLGGPAVVDCYGDKAGVAQCLRDKMVGAGLLPVADEDSVPAAPVPAASDPVPLGSLSEPPATVPAETGADVRPDTASEAAGAVIAATPTTPDPVKIEQERPQPSVAVEPGWLQASAAEPTSPSAAGTALSPSGGTIETENIKQDLFANNAKLLGIVPLKALLADAETTADTAGSSIELRPSAPYGDVAGGSAMALTQPIPAALTPSPALDAAGEAGLVEASADAGTLTGSVGGGALPAAVTEWPATVETIELSPAPIEPSPVITGDLGASGEGAANRQIPVLTLTPDPPGGTPKVEPDTAPVNVGDLSASGMAATEAAPAPEVTLTPLPVKPKPRTATKAVPKSEMAVPVVEAEVSPPAQVRTTKPDAAFPSVSYLEPVEADTSGSFVALKSLSGSRSVTTLP